MSANVGRIDAGDVTVPKPTVDAHDLPPLVRRYVDRAVPNGPCGVKHVRLTQVGQMWQRPGGRALAFFATEELSAVDVGFSWRARFSIAPLVSIRVLDEYRAGTARLEARALRVVPIMRRRGPELDVGEAIRYLAELPWVPQAILANRHLEWRELDDATVEVATRLANGRRAAVELSFDVNGDVRRSFSRQRPRLETGSRPTPWSGVFSDYDTVGGVRVPARGEVRWELADGPFVYWSGRITSLEAS